MPTSLVSTGVQFPDSTIQTTAAGSSPSFTASGTISSAGLAVGINTNGTVSVITGATAAQGASTYYPGPGVAYQATGAVNDTGSTILIFQQTTESGSPGKLYAGTISGTAITFGSGVSLGNSIPYASIMYCPAQSVFVVSYNTFIRCVSVSGTTITLGSALSLGSFSGFAGLASDCSGSTVFGTYRNQDSYLYLAAWTVSGTSISLASQTQITGFGNNIDSNACRTAYSGSVICSTGKNTSTGLLYYNLATYSGGFTLGDISVNVGSGGFNFCTVTYASPKDCFIFMWGGYIRVLTYSGTIGSLGATTYSATGSAANYYAPSMQYNNSGDRLCVATMTGSTSVLFSIYTVNTADKSITLDQTFTPYSGATGSDMGAVFCSVSSTKSQLVANTFVQFRDANNNGFRAITLGYSTRSNVIGIAQNSATNGQSVSVKTIGSIDSNQSGLSAGTDYYLTPAGSLTSSVNTGYKLGKATSATNLLITMNA